MVAEPPERVLARLDRARMWCDDDPDPVTAQQLESVIAAALAGDVAATNEIGAAFSGRLEFGTAGLRAPMGWGPRRMNRATVARAAAGFGKWLLDHETDPPVVVGTGVAIPTTSGGSRAETGRGVVVGYDARHQSATFARDSAQILAGLGLRVWLLPRPLPTPVLAFAIGALQASAGVMVTASHNPAGDNGYKVYVGRRQIAAPVDAQIAAAIDAVPTVSTLARSDAWTELDDDVVRQYVERAASLVDVSSGRSLRVVYTPVHGVAGQIVLDVLRRAGFDDPLIVAEQFAPDPDFATVTSPNPEDPHTLRLAIEQARNADADLIVATDPDGDRCAVALPDALTEGGWRVLSGNEVGDLLGVMLADDPQPGTFATTIVSAHRLEAIARAHGRTSARTLTGFKWLSRVPHLRYAYEEAIGYCVDPEAVLDKDGITAAVRVVELAATLRAEGRSLVDALLELDLRYGVSLTDQITVGLTPDGAGDTARFARLLDAVPADLAGLAVQRVEDLAEGVDGLPSTAGVRIGLAAPWPGGMAQVIIRPSGTEPKLKVYLEVALPPAAPGESLREQQHTAGAVLAGLSAQVSAMLA